MGGIALLSVMSSLLSVQSQEPKVDVSLLPEAQALASGRPFDVVVRIDLERPWHIYWKNPGDTGIPTHVEWHLPAGWKAEPVQFPAPKRFESGGTVSYGHEGEVLLISRLTPAPSAKGKFTLKASVDWLACIEWLGPYVAQGHVAFAGRLGVAYVQHGDYDAAEEALRLAVEHGEVVAANDLAILLRDTDRLPEALHVLRHAAEGGDEQAPANLVALLLEAGDLVTAGEAAEEDADEARPGTIVAAGDVRAAESRPDAAEQAYRRAIQLGGVRAHSAYGQFVLAAYGDAAGAEEQFRLAWRHNEPGWPYQLGRFLIDDGRGEEAREFLEVAAGWGGRDASDLLNELDGVDPAGDGT